MTETRWTGRTDPLFAEVAEALGTTTDLIMAAMPTGSARRVYVLATPGAPEDKTVFKALLYRDLTGVLQVASIEKDEELWPKLEAEIRKGINDRVLKHKRKR